MYTVLKLTQPRPTGQCLMSDFQTKFFYRELHEGKRSQDGKKKRYKDILKSFLKDFDIPIGSLEQTAQERSK